MDLCFEIRNNGGEDIYKGPTSVHGGKYKGKACVVCAVESSKQGLPGRQVGQLGKAHRLSKS